MLIFSLNYSNGSIAILINIWLSSIIPLLIIFKLKQTLYMSVNALVNCKAEFK